MQKAQWLAGLLIGRNHVSRYHGGVKSCRDYYNIVVSHKPTALCKAENSFFQPSGKRRQKKSNRIFCQACLVITKQKNVII